jgi:hypothetical protein
MSHPRLQFRLRSLFVVTFVVAIGCLVGPPAWSWAQAKWFQRETPGPQSIRNYAPIKCSLGLDDEANEEGDEESVADANDGMEADEETP